MKLVFYGEPTPKQSARFRIAGVGKKRFIASHQKQSVKDIHNSIALSAKSQLPRGFKLLDCPLEIKLLFVFSPLKSFSKKKIKEIEGGTIIHKATKPDLDNTQKLVLDALEGIVYTNDSRICRTYVEKIYGLKARTEIEVKDLELKDLELL